MQTYEREALHILPKPNEDVLDAQKKLQAEKPVAYVFAHLILAALENARAEKRHKRNDARAKNKRCGSHNNILSVVGEWGVCAVAP